MNRNAALFLLLSIAPFAPFAVAQEKPDRLAALRQTADTAAAKWEALAKGLEAKIERILPCDPASRAAVEEVIRASDARLNALSAYLKAAAVRAKADTDAAKRVLAAQAALAGGWNTERAEADQERAAIEAQVAELKESMRKRGSLIGAEQVLMELAKMVRARAAKSEDHASARDAITGLLGDLVVAYQERQTAVENESTLLDAESTKWSAYYVARFSRAVTECSVISGPARKKQR